MADQWTSEHVEKLKKLWSEGLSASQIAAQIGGVSRNAVIGKVRRLNLPGRLKGSGMVTVSNASKAPKPPAAPKPTPASPPATAAAPRSSSGSVRLQGILPIVGHSTRPKKEDAPPKPEKQRPKPLFSCRAVVLAEVRDDECEYCLKPEDDGYSSHRTLYCGNPREKDRKLFCSGHAERLAKSVARSSSGTSKGGRLIGHFSDTQERLARYVPQS